MRPRWSCSAQITSDIFLLGRIEDDLQQGLAPFPNPIIDPTKRNSSQVVCFTDCCHMLVYRFFSAKFGLEALANGRLRTTRIAELNDPFELLGPDLSNRKIRKAFRSLKADLDDRYGLLCFSRSWRNPVIWSHYADRHRGLCLGFVVPDRLLLPVKYVGERLPSTQLFCGDDPLAEMKTLLCTKFSHWKYESEMRCFVHLDDLDPVTNHYYVRFGQELSLKKIIVGSEADISRKDISSAVHGYNGILEIFKARAAFKTFRVVRNKDDSLWH